jgi:hypothetical protein
MSRPTKISASASVVVRGSIDPGLLTPAWLHGEGLLALNEAVLAEMEVVLPDVVKFSADILQVAATRDRLIVRADNELNFEPMKDVAVGILRKLPALQVGKIGINHDRRYAFVDVDAWHAVGHLLAPKEAWQGALEEPGMLAVVMQGARPDDRAGYIRVRVESFSDEDTQFGVVVDINDHFDVERDGSLVDGAEAADLVQAQWRDSGKRSVVAIEKVLGL